ncbi:transmembrane protein, putative (macronuclear) [Tetrahymena thermophila SB210]|uniref:Transmembrane protein, putative n=1 Tax=Tetrahymena thermophila (strain SB210) TaxID=312017 RepID=W7X9U1_TETTS|nr:transmembrane protein, putative [Tetrahymena thermophila SB210]EWS74097.1 transmembrane protein, putative [Tetrahymena thermophila SB210]|eukprot:XP_012653352.1 transmembrane protein, putative [Tetrahymena thermophila SB210]
MNKQLVLFLVSVLALVGLSIFMLQPLGDHTDCFQYHDSNKCTHMGCKWDGSMCHDSDSEFFLKSSGQYKKHSCPSTSNPEECAKSGCQFVAHICVDMD